MPIAGKDGVSVLAIMAEPRVLSANASGMGVVALTATLDGVLFANRMGRTLLGASEQPVPYALSADRPFARQVRSSQRLLAMRGETRILLRASGSASGKPIVADLIRVTSASPQEGEAFVLLIAPDVTSAPAPAADFAAELLADAALGDVPAAIFSDAGLIAATPSFAPELADEFAAVAARFLGEEATLARTQAAGHAVTLARVSHAHAILRIDAALPAEPDAAAAALAEKTPASASGAPTGSGFGSFSVKRQKLPGSRAVTSMSALVQRWHKRRDDATGGDETASGDADAEPSGTGTVQGQTFSDNEAEEIAVPLSADLAPDIVSDTAPAAIADAPERETVGEPASDGERPEPPLRQHSIWGEPVVAAADEAADDETLRPASPPTAPGADDAVADDGVLADDAADGSPGLAAAGTAAFVPNFAAAPVRFVWQIDRDGLFRSLSSDFAAAVGPASASVIGRSFGDIARAYGFDADGDISRLLERRDTWSGRSILWPVEGSARKVPVDLAALPIYARDRSFDGFRGFGIVRMSEAAEDPSAIGLRLVGSPEPQLPPEAPLLDVPLTGTTQDPEPPALQPAQEAGHVLLRVFEASPPSPPFGRRAIPPPDVEPNKDASPSETVKVIRLEERRRPRDGALSQAEEAAFREIGMKLGQPQRRSEDEAQASGETTGTAIAKSPTAETPASDEVSKDAVSKAAGPAPVEDAPSPAEGPGEADEGRADRDRIESFEPAFRGLPLPILVQMRGELVYFNEAFAALTGFDDIAELNSAGGLDRLFVHMGPDAPRDGDLAIELADGAVMQLRVNMQRVTLAGSSMLVMSFTGAEGRVAPADIADEPQSVEVSPESEAAEEQTEAALANVALRAEVDELRTVLDTATDGIVLLDMDGRIRSMNGSALALFGVDGSGKAEQHHLSTLFAHESQRAVIDYLDMLRETGMAGILNDGREVIGRVSQGGFIPLFITIGRLGEERGWCVVIRDIAHWKRIEEDLVNARRQAEAASLHKSRFLANISHELRTPLNAIIGFADVMASEYFGPVGNERYLEYLGDIKRSGHHVLDLVNDLLDLSKIEAGKVDLSFEAVLLNEVVAEVVSLMQPQANRERVIVRSNLPASVPPVVADRRTIRQISLNLIANAIRFTPAGGQIIASTIYTNEGDVVLRFRDSGIGMTQSEIEIALTPFQQVQTTSRAKGDGTGLGLPLTKAMVEANRALFSIASTPGEGTLVEISFPSQRVLAD